MATPRPQLKNIINHSSKYVLAFHVLIIICKVYKARNCRLSSSPYLYPNRIKDDLFFPILLNFERPFPLEMFVFVIVCEKRTDAVRPSRYDTGWRILRWSGIRLKFCFRGIRAYHMCHLVN